MDGTIEEEKRWGIEDNILADLLKSNYQKGFRRATNTHKVLPVSLLPYTSWLSSSLLSRSFPYRSSGSIMRMYQGKHPLPPMYILFSSHISSCYFKHINIH